MNFRPLLLCIPLFSSPLLAQGPLDPPAGPPAPSMKTAQEIFDEAEAAKTAAEAALAAAQSAGETRTPITSLPFDITQSGSYYFPGNLEFSDLTGSAIAIFESDVTLDLNGFTLSSTATVTGSAIFVQNSASDRGRLTIRNGFIRGTTTVSNVGTTWDVSPGGFDTGIKAVGGPLNLNGITLKNLTVAKCRVDGFNLLGGPTIVECSAIENGGTGITVSGGSSITRCVAVTNGGVGISAISTAASNCVSRENGGAGFDLNTSAVAHSQSNNNGGEGFKFIGSGVLSFSLASGNDGTEIDAGASVTQTGNSP